MRSPLISVAMPVHNGGQWLDAALSSLPAADDRIEVVIRDSSPAGPSPALIEAHRNRLAIDYAWVPDMPSWTRKTNLCVAASNADHGCVLHQDDLWLTGRLERMRAVLARHPNAALILSPARIVDAAGRSLGEWRMPLPAGRVAPDLARDALLIQNNSAMPAPVFRRDAFMAVGGLDETLWYTPDWDLWLKLAAHGPVVYDPFAVTAFRIHGTSLTLTGDRDEFADQLTTVLGRHLPANSPIARLCRASVRINILLARALAGEPLALFRAAGVMASLGPQGLTRYLHGSQLLGRALPRVRARLAQQL